MATRIRLRRVGRKGQAYFRIVVADSKSPRDGRFVATIGNYNPRANPAVIDVNAEQARAWLEKGATPTDTVRSLLKKAGVLGKSAPPSPPPSPPPAAA
ncbi:MAG TPA: 30S ribosomal protein S16 [Gemmatimonadales bacterium]|jgi:small subunit ribosomal protein S16